MRRFLPLGLLLVVAVLGRVWLADQAPVPAAEATPAPPAAAAAPPAPVEVRAEPEPPPLLAMPPPAAEERNPVDLEALRKKLPDNLYWLEGVPTSDPEVARGRAARAERWNAVFGRIQAGEATEAEIKAYFEQRRRLHTDYLAVSTAILDDYGAGLSERDRGLHELSARMHQDRLAELPRLEEEALARRAEQERKRRAWEAAGKP